MNFNSMLDNLYTYLETTDNNTLVLPAPEIIKSTTRVMWKNVKDFLKVTKTHPDHFIDFFTKESGKKVNWYSDSVSDGIIIHYNKILASDISNIMKKYIEE